MEFGFSCVIFEFLQWKICMPSGLKEVVKEHSWTHLEEHLQQGFVKDSAPSLNLCMCLCREVGCLDAGVRYESCAIGGGGGGGGWRRGVVVVITEEHSVLLPDGLLCPKRRRRAGWRRRSDGGGDWVVEDERRRGERAGEEEAPTHQGAVRLPRRELQGAQYPQPGEIIIFTHMHKS